MNEKLRAKDLINAGLFTVLYFVLGCCVAIPIGFVPIFLPILGSLWTLITGIPFMLFAVRARKFGMVTLMAILSGLLMGFTGMGFWGVPLGVVFGLLGDRRSGASGRPQDIKSPGKDHDPLGAPALLPPGPCRPLPLPAGWPHSGGLLRGGV